MKILIVGSGGREHAIAWKICQSRIYHQLFFAPGNPGMAALGENVPIQALDNARLVKFARDNAIDLVIIGPEAPLAAGLADDFAAEGISVFGPSKAAAQIEASKVYSKNFMEKYNIPTARFAVFDDLNAALAHLEQVDYPVVIKASGLAAGKGVILPASSSEARTALEAIMLDHVYGSAGESVVIEERLYGEEVSLLAFSDGNTVIPMPPAQDHKRLLDGDAGPNTGGMGAYAPAPVCSAQMVREITRNVLEPTVRGLAEEGMPFVGVLYAGLILTDGGAKVLEFNCRFGDPETQVILPLLETDLAEICVACTEARLDKLDITWQDASAVCVVAASKGYPERSEIGMEILGLALDEPDVMVFHAGTKAADEKVITAGGRVLGVTAVAAGFEQALARAYQRLGRLHFEGMQYRKDIGWRAIKFLQSSAYASSGVDIDAGNQAVKKMSAAVKSTYSPAVLAGIGAFGGLFDAGALKTMHEPVLVASTDGVGTKIKLAAAVNRYHSIGMDIVNHCIDDILVQGAKPLFFLDYFASSKLNPDQVAEAVGGMAQACREAGCALLGGETAEMPGVYLPGEFDIAGTIVGVLEKSFILPRHDLAEGDLLVGLASSGAHTNGYSLIRRVFEGEDLEKYHVELGMTLADALLAPHRSYLPVLGEIVSQAGSPIKALAHLTGGGFIENIPRVLPESLGAHIFTDAWEVPPLFKLIQARGMRGKTISRDEMYRVFNMGIGMVAVIAPEDLQGFQAAIAEETWVVGKLVTGEKKVVLV